jgi:arylsulfatase A-like enzyme
MAAGNATPFGGKIDKTVAGSRPWWPAATKPPEGAPNILVVLFDDVGFSDFGCYGSRIRTPTIDKLAAEGLRYSGFHTTAMCSTTRAALLTGRNHHSVGVGCLPISTPVIRLPRQDRARGGNLGGNAAAARLSQLHGRQMACDAADRGRRDRPVRRLAARPRF